MLLTSQFLQFSYLESIKIDEKLYTDIFLLFLFVIYLKNTIHILNFLPK